MDESAVRAGWADEHWAKNSLLVSFYDETWGGERFFEILNTLKQDVNKNIDLIEFMYLCLQFGYKGKYQVLTSGELEVDKIKRDLLAIIHSKGVFIGKRPSSQKYCTKKTTFNHSIMGCRRTGWRYT